MNQHSNERCLKVSEHFMSSRSFLSAASQWDKRHLAKLTESTMVSTLAEVVTIMHTAL